ncbi:MAG: helix-turn-helix domain-containing protein [Bacilli bacterium]
MTLGQKLKEIRNKFGLSQQELAKLINVSRQAITKWETEEGLPDTENLKELSKLFGITIDYLLDNDKDLPLLVMRKKLDKEKYKNKISSYEQILKEYYPNPWEIYILTREKKMSKLEKIFDFIIGAGTIELADALNDASPYYLAQKDNINLLINIKDWTLEVTELESGINNKKISVGKNNFIKRQKLK